MGDLELASDIMEKSDVKVVGAWCSPFAMRPLIALNIKSVEYQCLEEQIGCKSEFLLKSNPVHKKIPVLIHGDKLVCESLIIVEYIDQFYTSMRVSCTAEEAEAKNAGIEQTVDALALLEDAYVKCSKGKPFFGGDQIGYLDIAFGCFLGWLRVAEKFNEMKLLDEAKTPGLIKWADKFCADPAVKDVMPETDKLIEVSKIIARMRAAAAPPPPK